MMKRFLLLLLVIVSSCASAPSERYKIGYDPTWYPLNLYGKVNAVTAFVETLFQKVEKKADVNFALTESSPLELLFNLEDGLFDGILSSLAPEGESLEKYDFSDPILLIGPVLVVKSDSQLKTLSDFKEKILALSTYDSTAALMAQKYPGVVMKNYNDMIVALEDVANGIIDGALVSRLEAEALIPAQFANQLMIATAPLTNEGIRLVTLKGEQGKLLSTFNQSFKVVEKESIYKQLLHYYNVK